MYAVYNTNKCDLSFLLYLSRLYPYRWSFPLWDSYLIYKLCCTQGGLSDEMFFLDNVITI